jgi:hypothetical protein
VADEVVVGSEVFMPSANTLSPPAVKPFKPTDDSQKPTDEPEKKTNAL